MVVGHSGTDAVDATGVGGVSGAGGREGCTAVVKSRVCRANPCARKAVFEGGDGEKEPGGRDGTGQGDRGKGKGTSNNQLPLHCHSRSLSPSLSPSLHFGTLEGRRPQPPEPAQGTKPRARSLPSLLPSFLQSVSGSRISTGIESEWE